MATPTEPTRDLASLEAENLRLQRAVQELSVLNDLAATIGGSRSMEEVMRRVIHRAVRTVGAQQGLITLLDSAENDPSHTLVRTVSSSADHQALSPDDTLVGWMHLYKKPLVVNDPRNDGRFRGAKWQDDVTSLCCVPLLVQSRLIAILTLYNAKSADGFTNDDQRLLSILAAQSAQVLDNARLYEEEKEYVHLQEQLSLARTIQARLLPSDFPQIRGFDIAGMSRAAQFVGGDFFDIVSVDESRFMCWVGDVSGKGLPASLTMANAQAALRSNASLGLELEKIAAHTNKLLCGFTQKGTFITLALFDFHESGTFSYANAGHCKPILFGADGEMKLLPENDLVMGFSDKLPFRSWKSDLKDGEVLVSYSDGVNEAMNAANEQFGDEAAYEAVKKVAGGSATEIMNAILAAVDAHAGSTEQNDDITILVVKKTGAGA